MALTRYRSRTLPVAEICKTQGISRNSLYLLIGAQEARDTVLRRKWVIQFSNVVRVRPFFLGGPRQANAVFGWVLETSAGANISVCEALPLWGEIASRCAHAEFVALPKEPLQQLLLHR